MRFSISVNSPLSRYMQTEFATFLYCRLYIKITKIKYELCVIRYRNSKVYKINCIVPNSETTLYYSPVLISSLINHTKRGIDKHSTWYTLRHDL